MSSVFQLILKNSKNSSHEKNKCKKKRVLLTEYKNNININIRNSAYIFTLSLQNVLDYRLLTLCHDKDSVAYLGERPAGPHLFGQKKEKWQKEKEPAGKAIKALILPI